MAAHFSRVRSSHCVSTGANWLKSEALRADTHLPEAEWMTRQHDVSVVRKTAPLESAQAGPRIHFGGTHAW
jgi:hypothetical protein